MPPRTEIDDIRALDDEINLYHADIESSQEREVKIAELVHRILEPKLKPIYERQIKNTQFRSMIRSLFAERSDIQYLEYERLYDD